MESEGHYAGGLAQKPGAARRRPPHLPTCARISNRDDWASRRAVWAAYVYPLSRKQPFAMPDLAYPFVFDCSECGKETTVERSDARGLYPDPDTQGAPDAVLEHRGWRKAQRDRPSAARTAQKRPNRHAPIPEAFPVRSKKGTSTNTGQVQSKKSSNQLCQPQQQRRALPGPVSYRERGG